LFHTVKIDSHDAIIIIIKADIGLHIMIYKNPYDMTTPSK